ncbi:hypothetical protein [Rhodoligotrophos ferricapiens]|uniref:hypothetical protein n=1 Tax=Rhodoligotrophos ferricapiens TaxID=3069264 RepID=UPI00315D02AF
MGSKMIWPGITPLSSIGAKVFSHAEEIARVSARYSTTTWHKPPNLWGFQNRAAEEHFSPSLSSSCPLILVLVNESLMVRTRSDQDGACTPASANIACRPKMRIESDEGNIRKQNFDNPEIKLFDKKEPLDSQLVNTAS